MSIFIDNIEFDIEDEELPEIDYLEILSFDEIIKDNPTFIAYSKEELYYELSSILKNNNKSENFVELFYNTIDNFKKNYNNYVIRSGATKKEYKDDEDIKQEIILNNKYKELSNIQYNLSNKEKDKIFYTIDYDDKSKDLKFNPDKKTTIELDDKYNTEYIIYKEDKSNIPIKSLYYKVPLTNLNDFLTLKVMSKIYNTKKLNHTNSENYETLDKLFEAVRPNIDEAIKLIDKEPDYYNLDYTNLNSILESYNISLDFIEKDDYEKLKEVMRNITEKLKENKDIYKKVKITEHKIEDNRVIFYEKLQNIINLVKLSDILIKDYDELLIKLEEQKYTINLPPLLYDNINDIVENINNNNITLDDVIENIKNIKKILILDHSINTINNYKENNLEEIIELLEKNKERFILIRNSINEKNTLKFINFYEELKEIKEGNDTYNYEGVPYTFDNDFVDLDNEDKYEEQIISIEKITYNLLEKYWLNIKFREELGFIEILKKILPIINNIKELSGLPLDLEYLCEELFKNFRSIPTKFNLIKNKILENNKNVNDELLNIILKKKSIYIINNINTIINENPDINDNIFKEILEGVKEYIEIFNKVFYNSISFWSLCIQEDINKGILLYNENLLHLPYIDSFTTTEGNPIDNKEKKKGILTYLSLISSDIFNKLEDNNDYIEPPNILINCMKIIEDEYKDKIKLLREEFSSNAKKEKMGIIAQKKLIDNLKSKNVNYDKIVNEYINALLYMPGVNFKKVHKYLLGCCLQKIGKDFLPDSDLKGIKTEDNKIKGARNDLLVVKKKYSKERYTNKERKELFIYEKEKTNIFHNEDEDFSIPFIYNDITKDNKEKELEEWIKYINERKNNIIPKNKIDIDNINELKNDINNNIKIFIKTSGYNNNNLFEFFDMSKDIYDEKLNFKNILLNISSILNKHLKELNDIEDIDDEIDNEKQLLNNSIKDIKELLLENYKLNVLMCEKTRLNLILIKTYIITRVLCYPFNVDNSIGGKLISSVKIRDDFIKKITKKIYDNILKYLKYSDMPSLEDNIKFINSVREQNKNKTLSFMNNKTQEERDELNALKKIGINYNDTIDFDILIEEFSKIPNYDNEGNIDGNYEDNEYNMRPDEYEYENDNNLDDY